MLQFMLKQVLDRAALFLLSKQDADGLWRDYELEIGKSDAWITAVVGLALVDTNKNNKALVNAAEALLKIKRPNGWGYNINASCDADTTAWVIRFLAAMDALNGMDACNILNLYINSINYKVRTFTSIERFGSWAWEHDEVTAVTGMALWATGEFDIALRLRKSILEAQYWKKFWWQCSSYVAAKSLEFLQESGGISEEIRKREIDNLVKLAPPVSIFDLAQRVSAEATLGTNVHAFDLLLKKQMADGGWSFSSELLVPDQLNGVGVEPKTDFKRLMTTASVVLSIMQKKSCKN